MKQHHLRVDLATQKNKNKKLLALSTKLHGVLFASEMQVHQALFESDALSIIHDLTSKVPGSDFGHILEDIRVASSSFNFCSFHHLKRDGNRAAHSLALEAKSSGQSKIWKGNPPPCIQGILSDDLLY